MTKENKAAGEGHNSGDEPRNVGGVAGERLNSFLERVERLNEEKANIQEDIKEIYGEAKAVGFDAAIMKKLVALRKMEPEKRREQSELLDLYASATGMLV